ncbi:Zn-ribbon containing protein [Halomicroarcula sp. GCM10025324]|uniref:OapC/ArvC family zinc-ribbon domain-containing protein n=1 Tax=Haloarcula TaxID=2237 RepID=UPI0023E8B95F|nr:Zn-ribbon containing protein [Halomicroarcula sp. ZS-22-S1]
MPHQCTNCARVFEDGSKEMLSGCPDCGGNKFQFRPSGVDDSSPPDTDAEPPEPPGPDSSVARTVGKTAARVQDFVGGSGPEGAAGRTSPDTSSTGDSQATDDTAAPAASTAGDVDSEDAAQASARGDVVSPDELPSEPAAESGEEHRFQPVGADPDSEESDPEPDRPDLQELRKELNDQFESIKVLEPGQYELNLMELYDREEYIVALQEDGRYSIQVPDAIRNSKSE